MLPVIVSAIRQFFFVDEIKAAHTVFKREQIYKLVTMILVILLISGFAISASEGLTLVDGVWWSIVTMTTIGYGDIAPKTLEGRCVAVLLMVFGISVICMFTGKIAEFMMHTRLRRLKGFSKNKLKNHVIICNWNSRALDIIKNMKATETDNVIKQIVVVGDGFDREVLDDLDVAFCKGPVNEDTLKSACLSAAETVIILGDSRLEHVARDAKCVLDALTIESLNPDVYTIVELVDSANEVYCKRANVDEVISGFTIGGNLIAQTALNHGMSTIISDILSNTSGSTLSIICYPAHLKGTSIFYPVSEFIKKEMDMILLGVQTSEGHIVLNPSRDYVINKENDKLLVLKNVN